MGDADQHQQAGLVDCAGDLAGDRHARPADPLHHCAHNTAGYPGAAEPDALATIPVTGGDAVVGEIRAVGWRA
jgi:hypothetical protein